MPLPHHHPLHPRHFRWLNGVGFSLTLFFALWAVVFVLSVAMSKAGLRGLELPMPFAFGAVAAVSLVACVGVLAVFMFRYVAQGLDVSRHAPRVLLFAWTCAGVIFFLSQALLLVRGQAAGFPTVPQWMSNSYWYLAVVGAVVFSVLMWVNAEAAFHEHDDEDWDEDEEDWS